MPFDSEITERSRDLIVLEKARAAHLKHGLCFYAAVGHAMIGEDRPCYPLMAHFGFADVGETFRWHDSHTPEECLARFDAAIERLSQ